MTYQNGTYIAFHAESANIATNSDVKYYNQLKAWSVKKDDDFTMIRRHEKTDALQYPEKRDALRAHIKTRLHISKNLLLVIEKATYRDADWVPLEIRYAIDECELPVIAAYTNYEYILEPTFLSELWPRALKERIDAKTARVIHIPFKKEPIKTAINQFYPSNLPTGPLSHYPEEVYRKWGIIELSG